MEEKFAGFPAADARTEGARNPDYRKPKPLSAEELERRRAPEKPGLYWATRAATGTERIVELRYTDGGSGGDPRWHVVLMGVDGHYEPSQFYWGEFISDASRSAP